ncbi:hypothetical protein [Bacillus sp. Marseille-P3800]|uniref:hypothetical protein n=1 Tax=Bacillus sp. Marseille-P3800 TaxID=2014782 RepID=UPI000C084A8A|nr:hypothetical protein [Bacillus sp. Marseille-P3800]
MTAYDWNEWFNSEEGKRSIEELYERIDSEQESARQLELKSNLKYPDGQKVRRADLYIDLEAKERYFKSSKSEPYGYYCYVFRINEDETIDVCFDANFALKMNDYPVDFSKAQLVERDHDLYSPIEEILK